MYSALMRKRVFALSRWLTVLTTAKKGLFCLRLCIYLFILIREKQV